MGISKRLTQIIASGFALAASSEAQPWKSPRPPPDHPAISVAPPPLKSDHPTPTSGEVPPAGLSKRELTVFASGFAFAAAATVGLWTLYESGSWPWGNATGSGTAAQTATAQTSGRLPTCSMEPIAPAASQKDGLFPLQSSVEGLIAADITSFMAIGNQAAASGRRRDAEAAYLMSCRVADKLKGPVSAESAEAKYQLGSLYERLAVDGGAATGANRAELLARAERLYQDSAQAMTGLFGKAHEKTQLAAQGLEAVRQTLAQSENLVPTPAPVPVPTPEIAGSANAASKMPEPVRPQPVAAPPDRPAPQADTGVKNSPALPATQKCPEAVAALGLCSPAN